MNKDVELILSSGFLAFAHHSAFLASVEQLNLNVKGIMGTSSGALAGAMFAAGYKADEISKELTRLPPIKLMKFRPHPTKGIMKLNPVAERLRELLPENIEDLNMSFAAGVVNQKYKFVMVDKGPLVPAICASMAIPVVFQPVEINGLENGPFMDGGLKDRVGFRDWTESPHSKEEHLKLVHIIDKSTKLSGSDQIDTNLEKNIKVIESPKSGEFFFKLKHFDSQFKESNKRIKKDLAELY